MKTKVKPTADAKKVRAITTRTRTRNRTRTKVKGEQISPELAMRTRGKQGRVRVKWGLVDWSKQDVVIAEEMGCSRERVRQKRQELGVGQAANHHGRSRECKKNLILTMDTASMTPSEIGKKIGCSPSYATQVLKNAGKVWKTEDRRLFKKYDWSKADWGKKDAEIAEALGVKSAGVVAQYRFRHNIWKRGEKANVPVAEKVG